MTMNQSMRGLRGPELARRAALARQPRPDGVSGPRIGLLLAEVGALATRRSVVSGYVATKPQPLMLLPGFGAHPARMRRMAQALKAAGHHVYQWGLGFNLGPTPENFAFLIARVDRLSRQHGTPVALIGWSLGGLFAREIAKRLPGKVSRVITMGSPFSGDMRANNAWRAYQFITGHAVDQPPIECNFAGKPPVPTLAIWSPRDGIVAPRSACGRPGERDRTLAVRCSHLGFVADPGVITAILEELDRPD
ncbi:MAG TPA: alpha/beta fold hydrolase [Devosia sp.]|nr:alpha/beta fold hydrolase [Devosia sp.]